MRHIEKNIVKNTKRNSGGILIYISEKLVTDNVYVKTVDDSILWIRLSYKNQKRSRDTHLFVSTYLVIRRSTTNE